ncbi:5-oxoprolinase/urea amidolyase family protein [Daeguia caeni]|uniref:5-oxoprolinase/urea amidolyase family protein n=1 Tax=Daeguia caeni TaxID=439612 RepID=A0ABV9H6E0_9HYPH
MRFLPVNLTNMLVELNDLEETLALFASLQADPVAGVQELIPAAKTILIRFRPDRITAKTLADAIAARDLSNKPAQSGQLVEIPVNYDGEDLHEVAELTGLSVADVIRRHSESEYKVAFCGFAPGFGYLVDGDPALHVPRRQNPRTRIPAGSVALAGVFSGIYPQESPGGWQIIGTTPIAMWDIDRNPPALLQPGYRVRFRDMRKSGTRVHIQAPQRKDVARLVESPAHFKVRSALLPALFQDYGRFGHAGQGISTSGALDRHAFNAVNRIVGNPANTPALELTLGSFSFATTSDAVIALAGAQCSISVRSANRQVMAFNTYQPITLRAGDEVTIGYPKRGVRTYLAVRGGFAVLPVLDSASRDTLAMIGPEPVVTGDSIALKNDEHGLLKISPDVKPAFELPRTHDIVTLDIALGPRADWFSQSARRLLTSQLWKVTPQSSRVGVRLAGEVALERKDNTELPSEGMVAGAIQVPHNGQPVLFLRDHPLTGGYPVIATVAEYHLDLAAQIPINASIRFRAVNI